MNFMRNYLDRIKPYFEKNGRFEKYTAIYNMADTFFYAPPTVTRKPPHVRDAIDLKRVMALIILAVTPCVLIGIWNTGLQANLAMAELGVTSIPGWRGTILYLLGGGYNPDSLWANMWHGLIYFLPILVVTVVVAGFWEILFAIVRKREISEGFLATSILFVLTLPPDIPLWQAAAGISFGIVIGKEIFGGTGMNIVNPVLAGRVFLYFAYAEQMSGNSVWTAIDGFSGATPLAIVKTDGMESIFSTGLTWETAFLGQMQGSMGETSTLACLIGGVFLIVTGIASWRIVTGVLIGMILTTWLFNFVGSDNNPMFAMPWYWHMVLGGFAFGTMFLATDPVTSASTDTGKWIFGLVIGALIIIIRVTNPVSPEGVMFAILLANIFAPLIDHGVIQANIKRRRRYLVERRY
ncbi:MAG: NADH:ubiquinone reductase (Na(+)-transporting) subunit B [Gammaproteobacteria bacterium]|nr:NADH:ubiquinone reductase (Na(+)-transporting) subunit B [Gammaproteobacteria bacterium]NIN62330.1 NADH:ubiquinone reductase (Na(+)-transporting) subunit B [Gammaproteobacteria bacterium]NIO62339.1 NADH:ubiquinone reductase (Na(+)-transporting) subunit B [Gammaproteobacteria bacterium]NIP49636.1 NADH:ubiquinone reductase (Na(+)-transporting) subunit B [Gammaproteobacteria bacterium]NIQ10861.1 NADH:ubiquinone reductase (Na(+)-transporting) subunit B [Gammaproteobacteria bacterium]